LQTLESQGAQNMIVKQEDFETEEGVSGLKSWTFSRFNIDSKDSEKLYYEVVLFSQEGGLQQIMIFHEEGDTYANEISDRVLSSVELIQVNNGKYHILNPEFWLFLLIPIAIAWLVLKRKQQAVT
jgi:hypothetical protein